MRIGVEPDAATSALHRTLLPSWPRTGSRHQSPLCRSAYQLRRSSSYWSRCGIVHTRFGGCCPTGTPRITIRHQPRAADRIFGTSSQARHRGRTIGLCRFKSLSVVAPYTAPNSRDGNKVSPRSGSTTRSRRKSESVRKSRGFRQAARRLQPKDMWNDQYDLNPAQTRRAIAACPFRCYLLWWRGSKDLS